MSLVHLYDPEKGIHYSNGGFIPIDSETPEANLAWVEGPPPENATVWRLKSPIEKAQDIIESLPPQSQWFHSNDIAKILMFLDRGNYVMALYGLDQITPQDGDEAEKLLQIKQIFSEMFS